MRRWLFGRKPKAETLDPKTEAIFAGLRDGIAQRRAADPLIAAKVVGAEVQARIVRALTNEKGAHIESVLTALGALAGFACQMAVREVAKRHKLPRPPLVEVKTKDGGVYYMGDMLNAPLAGSPLSVWNLVAGAATRAGSPPPDLRAIFAHAAGTLGTPQFGVPRVPSGNAPGDTPLAYLRIFWPQNLVLFERLCDDPMHWPVACGLAAQAMIDQGNNVLDPGLAAAIVMESAIPMSKIDPGLLAARPG